MPADRALAPFAARIVALDDLRGPVLVACSGGADSLALLALVRAAGHDAVAAYVDHGLRPTSAHDAAVVADTARRVGAEFRTTHIAVAAGGNLEARARDARYRALDAMRVETGAGVIAVGHTRDDQAESVLLNLLRGSGTAGLAGMAARRGHVWRPLLEFRRAETHEICARLRIAPVHDVMNDDVAFRRVWLRRTVIPLLERDARKDLVDVIARQAGIVREDDEYLDVLAGALLDSDPERGDGGDRDGVDAARLAAAPRPIARRAVRRWLGAAAPGADHVAAVLAVAHGTRRAVDLPSGGRVERVRNRLRVVRHGERSLTAEVAARLWPPGAARFGRFEFETWIDHAPPAAWPDGRRIAVLDADRAGASLVLRAARAGDRYRPLGSPGARPVQETLRDAGIPAGERVAHPVLLDAAGMVCWVVGYRVAEHVKVSTRTRRHLWITAAPSAPSAPFA